MFFVLQYSTSITAYYSNKYGSTCSTHSNSSAGSPSDQHHHCRSNRRQPQRASCSRYVPSCIKQICIILIVVCTVMDANFAVEKKRRSLTIVCIAAPSLLCRFLAVESYVSLVCLGVIMRSRAQGPIVPVESKGKARHFAFYYTYLRWNESG